MSMKLKKGKKTTSSGGEKWYWNWFTKHLYMACAALFAVVFLLFSMLDVITRHNQELSVPSFMGMSVEQAMKVAQENSLRLEVTDSVHIPRMEPGVIYKQNPAAESKVKKNRRILLTINAKTPKMVKMPLLVGYSLRQAQSELASSQLKVGKLIYVPDIATNNVLEQLYNGKSVPAGKDLPSESVIDLKLGQNQADSTTYIPDLIGKPYSIIKDYLIDNSLNLGRIYFDETVKSFQDSLGAFAYRQEPARTPLDSTVSLGAAVKVYFTLDKTLIPVNEPEEE